MSWEFIDGKFRRSGQGYVQTLWIAEGRLKPVYVAAHIPDDGDITEQWEPTICEAMIWLDDQIKQQTKDNE